MASNNETTAEFKNWAAQGIYEYYEFPDCLKKSVPAKDSRISGKCRRCNKTQSSIYGVTSNFTRHLRVSYITMYVSIAYLKVFFR